MPVKKRPFFVVVVIIVFLSGCGGGSGGGADAVGSSYKGSTSQAVVTSENSKTIVTRSLYGSGLGVSMSYAVKSSDETAPRDQESFLLPMISLLAPPVDFFSKEEIQGKARVDSKATDVSPRYVYGSGGGVAVYRLSFSGSTDDKGWEKFSGTITYERYVENYMTFEGEAHISGYVKGFYRELAEYTLKIDGLHLSSNGTDVEIGRASCRERV